MWKPWVFTVLLLAVSGPTIPAQPAPGQHRGLWVGLFNQAVGVNAVLQLDSKNSPRTFLTSLNGPWPYWGNPFGAVIAPDNRHVVVPAILGTQVTRIGLVRWDPLKPGVVSTIWSSLLAGGPLSNWAEWITNSDGEIITIDNAKSPQQMMFFDPSSTTWSSLALPASTRAAGGLAITQYDRLTGRIVWGAWGPPTEIYATSPDLATTQLLARGPVSYIAGRYGGDVADSGDIYIASWGGAMYQVPRPGVPSLIPVPEQPVFKRFHDITMEHMAKPGVGFWAGMNSANLPTLKHRVMYVDPTVSPPAVTILLDGSPATMPTAPLEIVPLYTNDLHTVRTGRATWDVNINPGQGLHAGQPYALAASLSGTIKIVLRDGREFFIIPDELTLLSLKGLMKPLLTDNVGRLDAQGRGRARIDLATLGRALNGTVVHLAALVLDPRAPSGVAHVCQPWAFVVNVK